MRPENDRRRVIYLLIGLLFLLAPALVVLATLEALILLGDIEFADLTFVELVELYLLDLLVLGLLAVIAYRLMGYAIGHPVLTDATEIESEDESE